MQYIFCSLSFRFWFFLLLSPSSLMIIMASIWSSHKKKTRVWLSLTRDYIHATRVPFPWFLLLFFLICSCLCLQSLFLSSLLFSLEKKSEWLKRRSDAGLSDFDSLPSSSSFSHLLIVLLSLWFSFSFSLTSLLVSVHLVSLFLWFVWLVIRNHFYCTFPSSTSVHFFVFALSSLSFCSLDTFLSFSVSAFLLYQWHQ